MSRSRGQRMKPLILKIFLNRRDNHSPMSSQVRISDISLYVRCPRLIYFDALGNLPRKINPEHLLLRSIMLSISGETDVEAQLCEALSRLELELPLVYGTDPAEFCSAC